MILCLKIALVVLLSSVAVEGFGSRYSHRRRSSRDREFISLGRIEPPHDFSSYGKHGHFHFYRYPYYKKTTILEELGRRWPYIDESIESDSENSSEIDVNEFDFPEYSDWYLPKHHPCWPWRCANRERNQGDHTSWIRPASSTKTTLGISSMTITKKWNSISMLASSVNEQRTLEPVTTPMSILDITMPPKPKFILSRLAPIEEETVLVTTVAPETSQTKMSSPETSQTSMSSPEISQTTMSSSELSQTTMSSPETTTVSQAVLDCIENCISTPEFNPVCGTNDETYGNIGKLFCAKSCGVDVELRRMAVCSPVLPFTDDYDDYDNNDNSDDGDGERRSNSDVEGRDNNYDEESDNGGERLPPTNFEQSLRNGNLSFNSLTNESYSSSDSEPPLPIGDELLNSLSSDPSSSPLEDLLPSPRAKSLLPNDEILPPLNGNGNVIVTTGSISVVSSSTMPSGPRFRRTTHLSDLQKCMKLCPVTTDYYPICGTDLVTYINIDRIECARACGLEVQILCEQPCHLCNVRNRPLRSSTKTSVITTSSSTTTMIPTPVTRQAAITRRNIANNTPITVMQECIKACPVTSEYNPVCGTNNMNYMNPVHLLCVQMCGDGVRIAKFGLCTTESRIEAPIATTVGEEQEVTLSPQVLECTNRCVVTSEYNPVCGTNEETYSNPGKLECAKFCGIDVKLSYKGFCNGFSFSEFTSPKPANVKLSYKGFCNGFFFSEFMSPNPVGDSGVGEQVTASSEILRNTSQSIRLPLRISTLPSVKTIPATTPTMTQSTESTTPHFLPLVYSPLPPSTFSSTILTTTVAPTTTTTESLHSTVFTFAPDVLDFIFGNGTLKTTTDTTTKEDEILIDPRFGNEDHSGASQKQKLDPDRIVFPE